MIVEELIGLLGFEMTGEEKLRRFTSGIQGATSALAGFAVRAAAFGAAAAAAIGAGTASLGVQAVKVGATFEDLSATLETIEGSSEKAKESLRWVQDFAQRTPYDIQQVSEAFVRLKANGLEPQSGLLRSIGDAASAMGKSLMDGVEAIADAVRGENERLKELGINASVAGNKITYSWSQNGKTLAKTVKKDAAEIQAALQGIFDSRFLGAMDKRSQTFNGIVANLGDMWTNFLLRISDAGLLKWTKTQFKGFLDAVQGLVDNGTLDALARKISDTLVETGEAVKGLFRGFSLDDVAGFVSGSLRFMASIGRLIKSLFSAIEGIGSFIAKMTGLKSAWQGVLVALAAIGTIVAPWATAFAALILAVDDFIAWLEGRPSVIGDIIAKIKQVFADLQPSLAPVWEGMKSGWQDVMSVLSKAPQAIALKGIVDQIQQYGIDRLFNSLGGSIKSAWEGLESFANGLWDIGKAIASLMTSNGQPTALGMLSEGLGRLVGGAMVANIEAVAGQIQLIANGFKTLGEVLSKLAAGDWSGAFTAWVDGIKRGAQIVIDMVERMVQAFVPSFDIQAAWEAVVTWFETFVSRVETLAERVRSALSNMWPEPPAWWKELTGANEQRQGAADAGRKMGELFRPPPKPDNGVPNTLSQAPVEGSLAGVLQNAVTNLQKVSGPQASEAAVNTVANDNRVTNVTNTVNAPVSVTATTNATPAQIGQAAGSGVQRAGDSLNRGLAVTSMPGGMAK